MTIIDFYNSDQIISHVIRLVKSNSIRVTLHAHQEMVEDDIDLDDVLSALTQGNLVENYPDHERGPCCLICG
mgnify:CR=1 FL=1